MRSGAIEDGWIAASIVVHNGETRVVAQGDRGKLIKLVSVGDVKVLNPASAVAALLAD